MAFLAVGSIIMILSIYEYILGFLEHNIKCVWMINYSVCFVICVITGQNQNSLLSVFLFQFFIRPEFWTLLTDDTFWWLMFLLCFPTLNISYQNIFYRKFSMMSKHIKHNFRLSQIFIMQKQIWVGCMTNISELMNNKKH